MKAKILVIDDEDDIRFVFKHHLNAEGYQVETAEDYASAIRMIGKDPPDLVFADIFLEGQFSGLDILQEIRKKGMHCPVVMITAKPDIDTAAESVRSGAFDYLTKPVRKDSLLRVTRFALEHIAHLAEKERFRNNLEAVFRSVTEAIITVDSNMQITQANSAVRDILGLNPEEITGKPAKQVFQPGLSPCLPVLNETVEKKVTIREHRTECTLKNLGSRILILNTSPLIDSDGRMIGAVLAVRDVSRLVYLENELKERYSFYNIIGKDKKMQKIYELVERLSDRETTVLITGESGTGKELIAKALHHSGNRSSKPMIVVNCSALAENLLESELFGHIRGAFTGAVSTRTGCFMAAHKGTLFLDEIGDVSNAVQAKLLRVLQEKEFTPVGDTVPLKADVRIIAATNRNLEEDVKNKKFREDLYYRLNVLKIELPPLREKTGDIPLLIKHFFDFYNKLFIQEIEGFTDTVLSIFMNYPWPGNVRELKHTMEYAFILCQGRIITTDHLPARMLHNIKLPSEHLPDKNSEEVMKLKQVLEKTKWNKTEAARLLGISRQTIYRKIEQYGIQLDSL